MSRVKTEAGAELHFYVVGLVGPGQALDRYLDNYIAAIEAEAVTAALTALRAKVEGLETFEPFMEIGDDEKVVLRAAVLAVIDEAMPK